MTQPTEREAIVAWLRMQSQHRNEIGMRAGSRPDLAASACYESAADAIERGDHLKGTTDET